MLADTKDSVASVLHIFERSCTQQHLKDDILPVDLYDCITRDSQQRNTVLPPATELFYLAFSKSLLLCPSDQTFQSVLHTVLSSSD